MTDASNNQDRRVGYVGELGVKMPCRVAALVNIDLEGLQTVNGIVLAENDYVLATAQTDATENGPYQVSTGTWNRAVWFNNELSAVPGTLIFTVEGTINSRSLWETVCDDNPIDFGTSEITFNFFAQSGAGTFLFSANNLSDVANATTSRTNLGVAIGSDVQAYDADLTAIAAISSNGVIVRTGAGTAAARTLTGSNGVAATNGDGVSGNPTMNLDIVGLAEDTTPDLTTDFIGTYDSSATTNKKVKLSNINKVYDSGEQNITASGTLNLAHGLGKIPDFVKYYIICKTTQYNWAAGDTVEVYPNQIADANDENLGFESNLTSTQINIYFGANASFGIILDKTTRTGNAKLITNTSWRLVVRAYVIT